MKQTLPIIMRSPNYLKKEILGGERSGFMEKHQETSMKLHQTNPISTDSTRIYEKPAYSKTDLTQN